MFLMEHFQEGGWGMWPILALLAITVYITLDRFMYVSKSKVDVDKLMSLLKSQIVSGNIQGAINTCQASTRRSPGSSRPACAAPVAREHDVQQGWTKRPSASCRRSRSAPATWRCWVTWPPSPACSGPSPASSSRSPASPVSTPR